MSKFCPYCGNPVKESDKFCIICGKPLLTDIPKRERKTMVHKAEKKEKVKKIEGKEEAIEENEDKHKKEILDIEPVEKKKIKFKRAKDLGDIKPLPEDVKEQMVYYIEYNDIQLNKKLLVERLNEISKSKIPNLKTKDGLPNF